MALNDVETVPGWKSWVPTKKWFATLILGLASVLAHTLISEDFGATERAELGTLFIALAGGYFKSNDNTVAGIPGALQDQVEGPTDSDTGFEDDNIGGTSNRNALAEVNKLEPVDQSNYGPVPVAVDKGPDAEAANAALQTPQPPQRKVEVEVK